MRRSYVLDTIDEVSREEGQTSPTDALPSLPSTRPLGPDSPFPDNVRRLFGLHALSGAEAAKLLGISQSTIVKWTQGTRAPSFKTAMIVGSFFQISAERLATADFSDLLANELANPERFRAVEERVTRARATLERRGARGKER